MKYINSPYLALVLLGCFCVLASYSWGRYVYNPPMVTIWATPEAVKLASVYDLTPEEVIKAVVIWRKP